MFSPSLGDAAALATSDEKMPLYAKDIKQFEKEVKRLSSVVYRSPSESKQERADLEALLMNNINNKKINKKFIQFNLIKLIFTESVADIDCKAKALKLLQAMVQDKNNDGLIIKTASFLIQVLEDKKVYVELANQFIHLPSMREHMLVLAVCHSAAPAEHQDEIIKNMIDASIDHAGYFNGLTVDECKSILKPLIHLAVKENNIFAIRRLREIYSESKSEKHEGRYYLFLMLEALNDVNSLEKNRKIIINKLCDLTLSVYSSIKPVIEFYAFVTGHISQMQQQGAKMLQLEDPLEYLKAQAFQNKNRDKFFNRLNATLQSLGKQLDVTAPKSLCVPKK